MEKYKAIANYIKNEIQNGNLKQGKKIPSIRWICEKFQCSKITAINAYEYLKEERIIYSIPKSGYYVLKKIEPYIDENSSRIDFTNMTLHKNLIPYKDFEKCINNSMELYKNEFLNPSLFKGLPQLIDTMHNSLMDYQIFAETDNIFITSGSQQAINILVQMPFCNDGDTILIEQPTYHGIINAIKINNVKVITINRESEDLDLDVLEDILKNNKVKFFYTMSRFHNPTSYSFSNNMKKKILNLVEKYNTYLVEDDYIGDLDIRKNSYPFYAMDMNDRVVYIKSYSKILMPGLRVACVVLPYNLISNFAEYKRWSDLNTSIVSQGALEIYIKSGMFKEYSEYIRKVFAEKMNRFRKLVLSHGENNIIWNIPKGGIIASIKIVNGFNLDNICRKLYKKNMCANNIRRYYFTKNEDYYLRISISRVSYEEMNIGIEKLIECIK